MPYGKYTKVTNYDNVMANLMGLQQKVINAIESEANNITDYMEEELKKDIAVLDGHTLEELAKMGHPYAEREPNPPHLEPVIHTQKGKLLRAVKQIMSINRRGGYLKVYVDELDVPYIKWLVNGTTKMIARPVFQYTWSRIRENCIDRLETVLRKRNIPIRRT